MSEDETELWAQFSKDIEPLEQERKLPEEEKVRQKPKKVKRVDDPVPATQVEVKARGNELDRKTEEKLQSGRMPIDGTLDLHGMTQSQAHRALEFFILEAHGQGKRTVLVITGKGKQGSALEHWSDPEPGVLKRRVPDWLAQAPLGDKVLRVVSAQRQHGGDGALYVYLRRVRG